MNETELPSQPRDANLPGWAWLLLVVFAVVVVLFYVFVMPW